MGGFYAQNADHRQLLSDTHARLASAEQALTRSGFTRNGNDWEPPVHGPSYHLMTYWRDVAMNKSPHTIWPKRTVRMDIRRTTRSAMACSRHWSKAAMEEFISSMGAAARACIAPATA
jgi:hypothetical protein